MTSDDDVTVHARSLLDQVPSRVYMQSLNGPLYARKHDPAAIFGKQSEDLSRFLHEPVADFTWISPDLCHDMHGAPGCTDDAQLVRAADGFVQGIVGRIERSTAWTAGSFIVVTFDEGDDTTNRILTLVVRKGGRHVVSHRRYDHYALLHTIESHFGVPCLALACRAPIMRDLVPQS